ncbi:TnsA endonuclease N-terminal domain-containing protein [Prauserella rugosa]|uniref:TnsA endonuclease-like protein n=1 Tax=Prauserella rugosa TaxID=43354 RepID=A0A660C3M3_9PSEU|nr:TnsA endonuclease N-terminal domain-containing protein [Prauserella rugosa]TWH15964.1 TnsA endonuclease-like protein [Prauserella rugosa]
MSEQDEPADAAAASHQGKAWTLEEDRQLVQEITTGASAEDIAQRHGRSVGGIRSRARRMIPPEERVATVDALGWMERTLAANPAYDWQSVLDRRRRARSSSRTGRRQGPAGEPRKRTADQRSPTPPAGADGVLVVWEAVTGHTLSGERRQEFLCRPATRVLTRFDDDTLRRAGRAVHDRTGTLLLETWALECRQPGLSDVTITVEQVVAAHPDVAADVRELVSAAAAEIRHDRARRALSRVIGLDGDPATLATVAKEMGLSRERIRQLVDKAFTRWAQPVEGTAGHHARTVLSELLAHPPQGGPVALLLDLAELAFPAANPRYSVKTLARVAGYVPASGMQHLFAEVTSLLRMRKRHLRKEAAAQRQLERATARIDRLLELADWPDELAPAPPSLHRLRSPDEVSADEDDDRRWYSPKLDRTVVYESKTELDVIRALDRSASVADFCEQPMAINYTVDGHSRTYYPDLMVTTTDGRCLLIEVKGNIADVALWANRAKARASRALCHSNGWGWLITDGRRNLHQHLSERHVEPSIATTVGRYLSDLGSLTWQQVRWIARTYDTSTTDIAALALQKGWRIDLHPWRLTLPTPGP